MDLTAEIKISENVLCLEHCSISKLAQQTCMELTLHSLCCLKVHMQEYISGELLPLCSAINEVKHVLCIGYVYMLYMQVSGEAVIQQYRTMHKEVNTDGALQGTGPL